MYKVKGKHLNHDPKVVNKYNILLILFISGNEGESISNGKN